MEGIESVAKLLANLANKGDLAKAVDAVCTKLFASSEDGASETASAVTYGSTKRSRLDSGYKAGNRSPPCRISAAKTSRLVDGKNGQEGPCYATINDGWTRGRPFNGRFGAQALPHMVQYDGW